MNIDIRDMYYMWDSQDALNLDMFEDTYLSSMDNELPTEFPADCCSKCAAQWLMSQEAP